MTSEMKKLLETNGYKLCPDCDGKGHTHEREGVGHARCETCKWKGMVPTAPQNIGTIEIVYEKGLYEVEIEGKRLRAIQEMNIYLKHGEPAKIDVKMISTEVLIRAEEAGLDYDLKAIFTNQPGRHNPDYKPDWAPR